MNEHRLLSLWDSVTSSYWFIPAVMIFLALAFSQVGITIDRHTGRDVVDSMPFLYVSSPEGARAVLSTIASSMVTIAGIVFSLVMVVFSLSAREYGSFVLDSFMRDRVHQMALGTFTAAFVYSLMVLRTVRGLEEQVFVPHFSVLFGVLLAVLSVGMLIYYIHHVVQSVKSFSIVSLSADELLEHLDALFPDAIGEGARQTDARNPAAAVPDDFETNARSIRAQQSGYLQAVDEETLLDLAAKHDLLIRLPHRPGDFVIAESTLAWIWPAEVLTDDLGKKLNKTIALSGTSRSYAQDIGFHFLRLAEIAVRALSPSTNDPFTAMMCIDRLGQVLCRLATRQMPSPYRFDQDARLRVIANPLSFDTLLSLSFDQIRYHACSQPSVVQHLLKTLGAVAACTEQEESRQALVSYMRAVHDESLECVQFELFRRAIDECFSDVMSNLHPAATLPPILPAPGP